MGDEETKTVVVRVYPKQGKPIDVEVTGCDDDKGCSVVFHQPSSLGEVATFRIKCGYHKIAEFLASDIVGYAILPEGPQLICCPDDDSPCSS